MELKIHRKNLFFLFYFIIFFFALYHLPFEQTILKMALNFITFSNAMMCIIEFNVVDISLPFSTFYYFHQRTKTIIFDKDFFEFFFRSSFNDFCYYHFTLWFNIVECTVCHRCIRSIYAMIHASKVNWKWMLLYNIL